MFQRLFDVFSRRPETVARAKKKGHEVPSTTRTRVFMWVNELYRGERGDLGIISNGDYSAEFWEEIARRILYRTGDTAVAQATGWQDGPRGVMQYIFTCPGEQFLDFLEDIFSAQIFWRFNHNSEALIDELNGLLRVDNLPYHLTHLVTETINNGNSYSVHIRAYPKVIMKESEVLHNNAIGPVMTLLERPHFRGANGEYLAALEDYRKGDIQDCLTKCGSAFESVLKVICGRKGWAYKQTDAAKKLLDIVLQNTGLDTYFEAPLIIIATLRNKLSSAHGTGTAVRQPARHIAQYALNATASAILLIAHETGEA
jgi:hypothetical protein